MTTMKSGHDAETSPSQDEIVQKQLEDVKEMLTRRMAIANGTCISFCNQPKAHLGLPWVPPMGQYRGKFTWMKR